MNITEALRNADPLNDDHWTQDGNILLEFIENQIGEKVTRKEVLDLHPHFNRANAVLPIVEEPKEMTESPYVEGIMSPQEFADMTRDLDLESLRDLLQQNADLVLENDKMVSQLAEMRKLLKVHKLIIQKAMNAIEPDVDNQTAIRQHLQRQAENMMARSIQTQQIRAIIKEKGITQIDPRAAIDKAMSRKNSRGAKRPTR